MNANTEHINIFIAYSRKDAKYMDKLRTHLTPLELSGAAKIWYDGEIAPGTNCEEEVMPPKRKRCHIHKVPSIATVKLKNDW